MNAGCLAGTLTSAAALAGQPVHLLIRLASGSVFYADPITWPGKRGCPGKHGMPVTCHNDPGQANPEPDESLVLPDTPLYGAVRSAHGEVYTPSSTATAAGSRTGTASCPSCAAPCCASPSSTCPTAAPRTRPCGCGTPGPARCPSTSCGAPTWPVSMRNTPSRRQGHPRPDRRQGPHPGAGRPVGPPGHGRYAQLLLARPLAADLRRPWETRHPPGRPLSPGRVRRGFANIRARLGTPAHVAKPARPGPGRPKGSSSGPAPRYPVPGTEESRHHRQTGHAKQQVKC